MIRVVKKGRHRFSPPTWGLLLSDSMSRKVVFDESCKYDLGGDDQLDVNKLFGFGYFPGHHTHSARFGWRWSVERQKIELLSYVYVNGERRISSLCHVDILSGIEMSLRRSGDIYQFVVYMKGGAVMKSVEASGGGIGYRLGAFFGGNQKAPHKMKILIKKN